MIVVFSNWTSEGHNWKIHDSCWLALTSLSSVTRSCHIWPGFTRDTWRLDAPSYHQLPLLELDSSSSSSRSVGKAVGNWVASSWAFLRSETWIRSGCTTMVGGWACRQPRWSWQQPRTDRSSGGRVWLSSVGQGSSNGICGVWLAPYRPHWSGHQSGVYLRCSSFIAWCVQGWVSMCRGHPCGSCENPLLLYCWCEVDVIVQQGRWLAVSGFKWRHANGGVVGRIVSIFGQVEKQDHWDGLDMMKHWRYCCKHQLTTSVWPSNCGWWWGFIPLQYR